MANCTAAEAQQNLSIFADSTRIWRRTARIDSLDFAAHPTRIVIIVDEYVKQRPAGPINVPEPVFKRTVWTIPHAGQAQHGKVADLSILKRVVCFAVLRKKTNNLSYEQA